jgi:hypothetical protein
MYIHPTLVKNINGSKGFFVGLIDLMLYLKVQKYIDIDKSTNFHVQ